jgi:hypothetical protein
MPRLLRSGGLFMVVLAQITVMTDSPGAQQLRGLSARVEAQTTTSLCGASIEPPAALPPSTVGPVVYKLAPCFERQGQRARVPANVYMRDIQLRPSRPSEGLWVPYDTGAERVILEDFQRLWRTHVLADLSVEVRDYRFSNGVVGKLVAYHITEQN